MTTLKRARRYVRKNIKKGCRCPCCGKYTKEYSRPLNYPMAHVLILMHDYALKNGKRNWLNVENYLKTFPNLYPKLRGDFPKLRYWKLIRMKLGKDSDGNPRQGLYRITKKGADFVEGKISVPKRVFTFDAKVTRFSKTETVTLEEALGIHFNYSDLFKIYN